MLSISQLITRQHMDKKEHTCVGSDKMCAVSEVIKNTNMYLILNQACDL